MQGKLISVKQTNGGIKVSIILHVNVRPEDLVSQLSQTFLKQAKDLQQRNILEPAVVFDLGNFASNKSLVVCRALIDRLQVSGINVGVYPNAKSFQYARRLGFFDDFEDIGQTASRPAEGRFMEIERISADNPQTSGIVARHLRDFANIDDVWISEEALEILIYSVGELISNVRRHAKFSGRVSFQYYRGSGCIEITVADCGIGIIDSLEAAGYNGSDTEILAQSIQKQVTASRAKGAYGEPSPGVGLYNVCRLAEANESAFVSICTGSYVMNVSNSHTVEKPSIQYLNGAFPGTIVHIRIPNRIYTGLDVVLQETLRTLEMSEFL